jgi:hypothetical protein
VTKLAGNVRPTVVTLRSESHAARIDLSAPLYYRRLCPGARKIKQALFLVVVFSVAGPLARLHWRIARSDLLPAWDILRAPPPSQWHVSPVTVCSK